MRWKACVRWTTDVGVGRISFHAGATRANFPRAKVTICLYDDKRVRCLKFCGKQSSTSA